MTTATGYDDATGNPVAAVAATADAEAQCDAWLTAFKDRIAVDDIATTVDSKQHGHPGGKMKALAIEEQLALESMQVANTYGDIGILYNQKAPTSLNSGAFCTVS